MEMVSLVDKAKIVRLHLEGRTSRQIADEVGVCRNTVDKYVREYEALRERLEACGPDDVEAAREIASAMAAAPEYDSSSRGDRKWAPEMEAALREILADEEEKRARLGPSNKQMLTKAQVHQLLVSQGFEISEGTVRKRINELTRRPAEAFVAQQYEFGERFEYDFGEVRLELGGRMRKLYLAVMCCPASDYRFALLYENQGKGVFLDSQVRFFEHMGGRFREGVYDNMRNVVSKFVGRSEKELNPDLVTLAAYYGFRVNVTNCFSGWEKGAVERSVDIVRRAAFAVEWRFASAAQARARLEAALAELNAGKDAASERAALMPPRPPYEVADLRPGSAVDKWSCVTVDGCRYSVPEVLVGKKVLVKAYPDRVVCMLGQAEVASHPRGQKGGMVMDIAHFTETLRRKPGALARSACLAQSPLLREEFGRAWSDRPREFVEALRANAGLGERELVEALRRASDPSRAPAAAAPAGRDPIAEAAAAQVARIIPMFEEARRAAV